MDSTDNQIRRTLISHWDELNACIARLNNSASIVPNWGYDAIKHVATEGNISRFEIGPIVANVPESKDHSSTDLYVVVRGLLLIDRECFRTEERIRTLGFATEAGYFRLKDNTLHHVYGAHYDFSENEVGHPVFHGQMKSFGDFSEVIKKQYDQNDLALEDAMKGILKNVRLPTAQMDIFSFFLQVVADHLLSKSSGEDEKRDFGALLDKSKSIQGAGSEISRLQILPAIHCYRSTHWYPPGV